MRMFPGARKFFGVAGTGTGEAGFAFGVAGFAGFAFGVAGPAFAFSTFGVGEHSGDLGELPADLLQSNSSRVISL